MVLSDILEIFVAKHEKLNMFKNGLTKIDNITKFEVDFILFFTCRECLDISLMFQVSFNTIILARRAIKFSDLKELGFRHKLKFSNPNI